MNQKSITKLMLHAAAIHKYKTKALVKSAVVLPGKRSARKKFTIIKFNKFDKFLVETLLIVEFMRLGFVKKSTVKQYSIVNSN